MGTRNIQGQEFEALAKLAGYRTAKLAKLCKLSVRQLERSLLRELGRSPCEWLNEQRILDAREPLLTGESIKKVAADLNFKQSSHFCRNFKEHFGMTPSEFVLLQAPNSTCRPEIKNVAQR